ncbi:50S ribosomal protein L11 methyltransferase [Sanyastnella coralliicola]|uniref:50S ribosomal protein L11 methyltransferase n=1 Tax=Sanyastnella coralliicola TaxID=3069118 RepID=UPI0027BA78A0|nr:50S ribosomal protein L11 methyltransferase [Longitalea sp. SCSIO 12813]
MDYCELSFQLKPVLPAREILIAELAELGFESFVEREDGLDAYIEGEGPSDIEISELSAFGIEGATVVYQRKSVARENWNAKWESDFEMIFVDDDVCIRAPFHDQSSARFDIVIQPKMSFGTGHHDTTWLMLKLMLDQDLKEKEVLDMGSGTGVLAILAEKLGASKVDAIDIDDWAKENCDENAELNGCTNICAYQGDGTMLNGRQYDVILANINRNVLTSDMPVYSASMNDGATIQFSGFFPTDFPIIRASAEENGLTWQGEWERNGWGSMRFIK